MNFEKRIFITPTDTVFGIGCHYLDYEALSEIYQIKKRPIDKKTIICIANIKQLEEVIERKVTTKEQQYIEKYWPGQVTFIFENNKKNQKIGIRMPDYPVLNKYIEETGPIYLTSLNISGEEPTVKFSQIPAIFKHLMCLSNEDALNGVASTIFDIESEKIIRQGKVEIVVKNQKSNHQK